MRSPAHRPRAARAAAARDGRGLRRRALRPARRRSPRGSAGVAPRESVSSIEWVLAATSTTPPLAAPLPAGNGSASTRSGVSPSVTESRAPRPASACFSASGTRSTFAPSAEERATMRPRRSSTSTNSCWPPSGDSSAPGWVTSAGVVATSWATSVARERSARSSSSCSWRPSRMTRVEPSTASATRMLRAAASPTRTRRLRGLIRRPRSPDPAPCGSGSARRACGAGS